MQNKIVLNDAIKGCTEDQDKLFRPEETVNRFRERIKTLDMDILASCDRIDNGRLDIPVFFSVCGKDAFRMTGTRKQMGKGATPIQAEASAVMELSERFSLFSFKNEETNFFTDTYRNVWEDAIDFGLIAKSVHDDSEDLSTAFEIFSDLPLKWTEAYSLTRKEETLLPFDWFWAINEFNGCCAGNCDEEALVQGICEIVERHVSSIISHERLCVPAIDPDSATDPLVREMIEKYRKAGIELFISDFTMGMGVPTVAVLAYDPTTFPEGSEIVWTAGTAPDPEKALSRALTEVAQLAGDFNTGSNYVASGLPKFTTLEEATHVTSVKETVSIHSLPDISDNNIRVEVENCLLALSKNELDVIAVNTRHPKLDIPAFYLAVPGAHFRETAHGRSVGMFATKHIAETTAPQVAAQRLKAADAMLPGKYYIQFYLGQSHLSSGDPETALAHFERALELDPTAQDIPSIYSYMGVCLKEMEAFEKALSVLEKGIALDPEREDIYNLMGFCHFKLKAHEKAIECFLSVLQLNPSSAIDYANIASNYRDMGEKGKAISYYSLAVEMDPSLDFARENLETLKQTS